MREELAEETGTIQTMKAICIGCKRTLEVDPHSGKCVDCLIAYAKAHPKPVEPAPFDPKKAQVGRDD